MRQIRKILIFLARPTSESGICVLSNKKEKKIGLSNLFLCPTHFSACAVTCRDRSLVYYAEIFVLGRGKGKDMSQVFTDQELCTALKSYLSKILVQHPQSRATVEELPGMVLRKSVLKRTLNTLVQQDFLEFDTERKQCYSLSRTIRWLACNTTPKTRAVGHHELFPARLVADRLCAFLQVRTNTLRALKQDDTWSQDEMQDGAFQAVCLRKSCIRNTMELLCEQGRVYQKGTYLYSMVFPTISVEHAIAQSIAKGMGLSMNGEDSEGYRDPKFLPGLYRRSDDDY